MGVSDTLAGVLDAAVERDPDHPAAALRRNRHDRLHPADRAAATSPARCAPGASARATVRGHDGATSRSSSPCGSASRAAGVIEVPVHSAHRGPLLEHILAESGARILFCDAEFVDRLGPLSLPGLEHVVVRGEADASAVPAQAAVHPLAEALSADPDPDPPVVSPGDVSCVLYTSGHHGTVQGRGAAAHGQPAAGDGQHRAHALLGARRPLHGVPALPRQRQVHVGLLDAARRRAPGARRRASAPRASGTSMRERRASPPSTTWARC